MRALDIITKRYRELESKKVLLEHTIMELDKEIKRETDDNEKRYLVNRKKLTKYSLDTVTSEYDLNGRILAY